MRSIHLDAWEFESSCSEEALQLDISWHSSGQHDSLQAFLEDLMLPEPAQLAWVALSDFDRSAMVCEHLVLHTGIDVQHLREAKVICVEEPDWSGVHLLISSAWYFIRYHWYTTA